MECSKVIDIFSMYHSAIKYIKCKDTKIYQRSLYKYIKYKNTRKVNIHYTKIIRKLANFVPFQSESI